MKQLVVLAFISMALGCAVEAEIPEKAAEPTVSNQHPYPSQNDGSGPSCPPPMIFTTIINGKEEQKIFYPPCFAPTVGTSKASDPPGWGPNTSPSEDIPNINNPYVPKFNPPGDPIPRKF